MEELLAILSGYGNSRGHGGGSRSRRGNDDSLKQQIGKQLMQSTTPAEQSLLKQALPLGHACSKLREFNIDVQSGRSNSCWLRYALANTTSTLVKEYTKDLTELEGIVDVQTLVLKYGAILPALAGAADKDSFEDQMESTHNFLLYVNCPSNLKQRVGRTLALSWLHLVAQWVANASLPPDGTGSFFIVPNPTMSSNARAPMVVSDLYLPFGVSHELAAEILLAGEERKMWIFQAQDEQQRQRAELHRVSPSIGASVAEVTAAAQEERQLKAAMEQSELKRRIIFDSIYSPELCRDGILLMDELASVIAHARSVWSSALWEWTKNSALKEGGIRRTISLVRDTFLGSKGDLWKTFVEACFPAVLPSAYGRRSAGRLEREVPDSFRKALHTTNLRDNALYEQVRLIVLPRENPSVPLDYSFRAVGRTVMNTIERIQLNASLPTSTELILFPHVAHGGVSSGSAGASSAASLAGVADQVELYDRLFTHHLSLQFALHALLECRLLLRDITVQTGIRVGHRDDAQSLLNHITLILTHYVYFLQVDVLETNFQHMIDRLEAEEEGGPPHTSAPQQEEAPAKPTFEDRVGEALIAAAQQQQQPLTREQLQDQEGAAAPTAGGGGSRRASTRVVIEEDAQSESVREVESMAGTKTPKHHSPPTFETVNRPCPAHLLGNPTANAKQTNAKKVKPCTSLQEAQRVHTDFLRTVVTGCFMSKQGGGGNHDVRDAIEATMRCTFTLYALLCNTTVREEIEAQQVGKQTQEVLQDLMRCIQLEVFPSLTRCLSVSTNSAHRSLWVRLDFNQWLSKRKNK